LRRFHNCSSPDMVIYPKEGIGTDGFGPKRLELDYKKSKIRA